MAGGWSKFVDLSLTDEEKLDAVMPMPMAAPEYPFGLRICLCGPELDKLDIDEMPDVGDYIDLRAFARVTSVSDSGNGQRRVELQIEKLAAENEMDEDMGDIDNETEEYG
jgi:hypothetical protein